MVLKLQEGLLNLIETILKGGSLSKTYIFNNGKKKFVRKEISLEYNREYGFVRWYSQLKKTQKMNSQFPDLFPEILNSGITNVNVAFYDIPYYHNHKDIKTILQNSSLTNKNIIEIATNLYESLAKIHSLKINTYPGLLKIYFKEEIEKKLNDALENNNFKKFVEHDIFFLNDKKVQNILKRFDEIKIYFNNSSYKKECLIHGNPTLENILYSTEKNSVKFIDLYEESIVDLAELDLSMVLQCSNSHYGIINDNKVNVNKNICSFSTPISDNFKVFNDTFISFFKKDNFDYKLIKFFEASQFIRMLPFKIAAGQIDKAKFFYVYASNLFQRALDL